MVSCGDLGGGVFCVGVCLLEKINIKFATNETTVLTTPIKNYNSSIIRKKFRFCPCKTYRRCYR